MAAQYQMEVEKVNEMIGEEQRKSMKEDIAVQKAVDLVTEAAVEK